MQRLILLTAIFLGLAAPASAEILVANGTLRARTLVTEDMLSVQPGDLPGALSSPEEAVGLETRVAIYPGRPIRPQDLGPPAIVERNQVIPLTYHKGGLSIATEGRALERGGVGDTIRVMNVSSKSTVFARIAPDGSAVVQ